MMRLKSKDTTVPNIFLNIGHLLDHLMMLIFAKAAYDAGKSFNLDYDEIIIGITSDSPNILSLQERREIFEKVLSKFNKFKYTYKFVRK